MKNKQIIVVGLGRFGNALAETLVENGCEVMAIDTNEERLDEIAPRITHTVCADATDAEALDALGVRNFDVAVVTDAGTPAISDPGTILVRQAAEAGTPVAAVPGPRAMAAAIAVSGIHVTEFTFLGFLPREKKDLQAALRSAAQRTQAGIVHESPYRVLDFMRVLADTLPQAYVSVSCDLSKLHELTLRGPVAEVLARMEANDKTEKGEYCIVIDFRAVPREEPKAESTLCLEARLLDLMLQGADMRDASRRLVEEGEKKNAVYAAALRLKGMLREEE